MFRLHKHFYFTILFFIVHLVSNVSFAQVVVDHNSARMSHSYFGYASKYHQVNGINMHFLEAGREWQDRRASIVLLHGFPYYSESWQPLIAPLSRQFHLLAPDARGFGYSSKPKEVNAYHISHLTRDIEQFIEKLTENNQVNKKVVLIGHDWGGVVAWSLAQQSPDLIERVVIINAPPYNAFLKMLSISDSQRHASRYIPQLTSWWAKLYLLFKGSNVMWGESLQKMHKEKHVSDQFKLAFLTAWEQEGAVESAVNWYKANIPSFNEISQQNYWPQNNDQVKVPSLLIWSTQDKAFTEDTFLEIPNHVEQLKVKKINTESHAPFLDHTDEVLEMINDYLIPYIN